jgi:hypothetical protein
MSRQPRHCNGRVLGNTAQAVLDSQSGLLEHFEAGDQGLAVTWVLPHRPRVLDPLVIESRLTGLAYAGQTAGGHHYADGTGTARLRVGNVTLADVAGGRWQVAIEASREVLRITVPASILAQATYPLAIDPLISPEFGMDAPIVVPAAAAQQNPAVAANGTTFLVAWEDQRNSGPGSASIYGTRVTAAGAISDPNGIAISPVGASTPAVAANGTGYLVVWVDGRNVATTGLDIYGARVNSAGHVLDGSGFPISLGPNDQLSPAVTANGADSFVVWQDGRDPPTARTFTARASRAPAWFRMPAAFRSALRQAHSPARTWRSTGSIFWWFGPTSAAEGTLTFTVLESAPQAACLTLRAFRSALSPAESISPKWPPAAPTFWRCGRMIATPAQVLWTFTAPASMAPAQSSDEGGFPRRHRFG